MAEFRHPNAKEMNEKLQLAVTTVMEERTGKFDKSFKAVAELIADYSPEELADRLVAHISPDVPWEVAADVLGILIWSTSDNGASNMRAAERWLVEAKNVRQVRIAISLDVYPFKRRAEMRQVLEEVARIIPEVAATCAMLINERERLPE